MAADRKTLAITLVVLALLAANGSLFVVQETERAIMLRFGRIVTTDIEPGLHVKMPFVHQVKKFDARVLTVDGEAQSFFTIERKRLIVDSFAKWRIANVETYYKATGGLEELTRSRLADRINDSDMPVFLLNHSADTLALIERVGEANVKLQYDVYHMQIMEGDLARTLQRELPRIGHVQIADNPGRHEPGSGEINYPFLFDWLDRIGYTGWVSAEYIPAGDTAAGLGWLPR